MRSWRRSGATVEWQQRMWKKNSGACRQGKKEEAAVRRQQIQAPQEESIRRFEVPATPLCTWQEEERGGEWEEEQAERAAGRQMGPPAPGGRKEW